MAVHINADLINGYVVTFLNSSGIYGDRQALQAKAKEWFPNTKRFISQEGLPNFLNILARYPEEPTAYANLLQQLTSPQS